MSGLSNIVSLVSAKDLSIQIGSQVILEQVDFEIVRGEIVTIVGPNGSGKTTLLRAIIGALPLTSGKISRTPQLTFGYVPQLSLIHI